MANKSDAALHRIVQEYDVFSRAYDRYFEAVDSAVCELDDSVKSRARVLIEDSVDVTFYVRDSGYSVDAFRSLLRR